MTSFQPLDIESLTHDVKEPQPVAYGLPTAGLGIAAHNVADNRVFEAFRASQTLQCACILDVCLAAVSILSFMPITIGLLCLVFVPFGLIGKKSFYLLFIFFLTFAGMQVE